MQCSYSMVSYLICTEKKKGIWSEVHSSSRPSSLAAPFPRQSFLATSLHKCLKQPQAPEGPGRALKSYNHINSPSPARLTVTYQLPDTVYTAQFRSSMNFSRVALSHTQPRASVTSARERLRDSFPISEVGCTSVTTTVGYRDQYRAGGQQESADFEKGRPSLPSGRGCRFHRPLTAAPSCFLPEEGQRRSRPPPPESGKAPVGGSRLTASKAGWKASREE